MKKLNFDPWAWQRELVRRAAQARATVKFVPNAPTAMTDGSTVIIPSPPPNATMEDYEIVRGLAIHEIGHLLRPQVFAIAKREKLVQNHPLAVLFNQIEDRAQERECAFPHIGDRIAIDKMHSMLNEKQCKAAAEKNDWPEGEALDAARKLSAALCVGLTSASDWLPRMTRSLPFCLSTLDRGYGGGLLSLYEELCKEGWHTRIRAVTDPESAFNLARELFKRLFPEMPEQPSKGSVQAQQITETMGKVPWELIVRSDHGNTDEAGEGAPICSTIDWSGKGLTTKPPLWYTNESVETPNAAPVNMASLPRDTNVENEVRRLLQSMARKRWDHEKLEGRLDKRNLLRICMPQVGDGTYNRSIFQKNVPTLVLDACVTVLVDSSGSMTGEKFQAATAAAISLYDTFNVALRVPSEVLGFTHNGSHRGNPRYWIYKGYGERRLDRAVIAGRMEHASHRLSGNSDGDALMFAFNRIKKQRESRKIIIILSDGNPAEAGNNDPDDTLRGAIQLIRGNSSVELYGIGIMDANVKRYYSKDAPVVRDASEVPTALVAVLKDILQKQALPS